MYIYICLFQISQVSNIEENTPNGTSILSPEAVIATDDDAAANLSFTIDWQKTTFTKNGFIVQSNCNEK